MAGGGWRAAGGGALGDGRRCVGWQATDQTHWEGQADSRLETPAGSGYASSGKRAVAPPVH